MTNPRTASILRDNPEDLLKCDICEGEKPKKEFFMSGVNICKQCVEENHCMSIK